MNFTSSRSVLVDLLTPCVQIAARKTTLPVLQCVRVDVAIGLLTASATDLNQQVDVTTPVAADIATREPGSFAVNAAHFLERVKIMPSGPVTVALEGTKIIITSGKRRHTLPVMPIDDIPPPMDRAAHAAGLTIHAGALATLLANVSHAVGDDTSRPETNGIGLEYDGKRLRGLGTNGKCLALADAPLVGTAWPDSPMLPGEAVRAVAAFVGDLDADTEVIVSTDGRTVGVRVGLLRYQAKLSVARFSPYERILDARAGCRCHATLDRAALLDAVESAALGSRAVASRALANIVIVEVAGGNVRVASSDAESVDDVPCDHEGKDGRTMLDATMLVNAIKSCSGERVRLFVGGELDPFYVVPGESEASVQVVMPVRP